MSSEHPAVQNLGVPTPARTDATATVASPDGTTSSLPVAGADVATAVAAGAAVAASPPLTAVAALVFSLTPVNVRNASGSLLLLPAAPPPLSLPQATAATRSRLSEARTTQCLLIEILANVFSLGFGNFTETGSVSRGRRVGFHVNRSTTTTGMI